MCKKLIFASTLAPKLYCLCTPSEELLEVLLERAKDDECRAEPLMVAEQEIEFGPANYLYDEARMRVCEASAGMATVMIQVGSHADGIRSVLVPVGEKEGDDEALPEGALMPGIGCPMECLLGLGLFCLVIKGGICAVHYLLG